MGHNNPNEIITNTKGDQKLNDGRIFSVRFYGKRLKSNK
jgi:hypothetical protein